MIVEISCPICDKTAIFADIEDAHRFIKEYFDEDLADFLLNFQIETRLKKVSFNFICKRCSSH